MYVAVVLCSKFSRTIAAKARVGGTPDDIHMIPLSMNA